VSPIFIITVVLLITIVYVIYRKQPGRSDAEQPAVQTLERADVCEGIEGKGERSEVVEANSEGETNS
jgi:hypothetical protein